MYWGLLLIITAAAVDVAAVVADAVAVDAAKTK